MRRNDVVELRVHGVSGTPPEELLDRGEVYRLAGDSTAGFYRPRLAAETTDGTWAPLLPGSQDGPQLEGYAWGGLTSGAPSRAFWLLLLPFTLANVAPRLRPAIPAQRDGRSNPLVWLTWYFSRVLGLALTVLLVLAAAGIGDDLIGWQCGQGNRCAQANPQWFAHRVFGATRDGVTGGGLSVEHRLALGTLIPLILVALLWFISRATINRYETIDSAFGPEPTGAGSGPSAGHVSNVAGEVGLESRWMWQNAALVQRLGAVHIQAGLATALWAIAGPLEPSWQIRQHPWISRLGPEIFRHGIGTIAALVICYGLVVFAIPSFSRHDESRAWHNVSRGVWVVLAVAWLVVGARLLFEHHAVHPSYLTDLAGERTGASGLPGFSATLLGLFLFEIAVLVALSVVVSVARWQSRHRPTPLVAGNPPVGGMGWGTMLMATTGVFLASVFSAGEYLSCAGWLNTGSVKPSFHDMSMVPKAFHLPEVIKLATLAYTLGVISIAVIVVAAVVWVVTASARRWHGLVDLRGFAIDYPDLDVNDPSVAKRRQDILRAFFFGRIVDLAGNLIAMMVGAGSVISGVISVILFGEHVGHWAWSERSARWLSDTSTATRASVHSSIPGLEIIGAYLTVLTLLLMVSLGALAFRVRATRRSVGILWDIASFWPRTAHPLAAPCYAERTVPDLITRIRWHRSGRSEPHGVVLAGHSQGTVISAAALIQLAEHAPHPPAGGAQTNGAGPNGSEPNGNGPNGNGPNGNGPNGSVADSSSAANTSADSNAIANGSAATGSVTTGSAATGSAANGSVTTGSGAESSGPESSRPEGDVLSGLSLLTFGCVLRRLYGRYFPAYFGAPVFDRLARSLGGTDATPGRWLNLWRYTDYLGGMVSAGPPPKRAAPDAQECGPAPICEEHLRDPAFFEVQPGDTVAGPPLRHSDFWKSPDGSFQIAVGELAEQVCTSCEAASLTHVVPASARSGAPTGGQLPSASG